MNTRDNDPLHVAINAKISAIAAASPSKPPWHADWMQLGPETPETERLRVYQAIRDAGDLPDDAAFYLISWQIDAMTSLLAEELLADLDSLSTALDIEIPAKGNDNMLIASWNNRVSPCERSSLEIAS